jgi:hypothetical protein
MRAGQGSSLVDETGRAELDLVKASMAKDLGESTLVVVVSVLLGRVDPSDIDDDIKRFHCGAFSSFCFRTQWGIKVHEHLAPSRVLTTSMSEQERDFRDLATNLRL